MPPAPRVAADSRKRAGLVILAGGTLLAGLVVYLVDRPAGSALMLPAAWHTARPLAAFGPLGWVLPDFAHAFALCLLTGMLARTRRGALAACLAWWLIDTLAEVGQAAGVAGWLATALPAWLSAYFVRGTFDPGDLLAVTLGAGLAGVLLFAAVSEPLRTPRVAASAWQSALAAAGLLLTLGSGGGGDGAAPAPVSPACTGQIAIDVPTYAETWQTDRPAVDLGGPAPTPGGVARPDCPGSDPGYTITWRNETTGASGTGGAWSRRSGSLLNFCITEWTASDVPLALGSNRIVVSGGSLGGACITIQRIADTTAPTVVEVSPADRASGVPINTTVSVRFSEDIDGSSVTPSTFTLHDPQGLPVSGSIQVESRRSARFTPLVPLIPQGPNDAGAYTARVTTGVRDAGGQNPLPADYAWTFRTGPAADTTPPAVTALEPAADGTCAGTRTPIQARFSEPIRAADLSASTFVLEDAQNLRVPGTVSLLASNTARLEPSAPLAVGSRYTATLMSGIRDLAGNALPADVRWAFTTGFEYGAWWRTTATGAPSPRAYHAAVWTGSEMIVAGGWTSGTDAGGRYDPGADRWTPVASPPFPMSSADQVAVWTGTEMIVYGGTVPVQAYDPRTDSWRVASNAGAPAGRSGYSVVWSGTELIVWGGVDANGARVMSGARYNPTTDTWRSTSPTGAPAARARHSAVWTGREMIVWGGVLATSEITATGARYDPASDTWIPLPTTGAPPPRFGHTAVWAGNAMTVWGFAPGGGRYLPATDSWLPMTNECAPATRDVHRAVGDGDRMMVWGGASPGYTKVFAHGAIYDPVADTWRAMSAVGEPTPRYGHSMIWTGRQVIVWGGSDGGALNTGAAFTR